MPDAGLWMSLPSVPAAADQASLRHTASGTGNLDGLYFETVRLGRLPGTDADIDRCRGRQLAVLQLEAMAVCVNGLLDAAGIDHRFLKGVATAHTVYERPELRTFADVDVLIPAGSLGAALELLQTELPAARLLPEVRRGFDARFSKDIPLRVGSMELDVHRTLVGGPFGARLDADRLFDDGLTFDLGGRSLPCLSLTDQFVHAALSVGIADDPPSVIHLRDMWEIQRTDPAAVSRVPERAHELGLVAAVARGVVVHSSLVGAPFEMNIAPWAQSVVPALFERVLLTTYRGPARSYRRSLAAISSQRGWRNRVRYAAAISWPSAAYLDARGFGRFGHIGRALRKLTGR